MQIGDILTLIGLAVMVIGNIVTITIFIVRQTYGLKALKTSFTDFKQNILETIKEFKFDINTLIEKNQTHTENHIKRLEEKQDKHNSVIERMAIVEQSLKSAHHRIDDMKGSR